MTTTATGDLSALLSEIGLDRQNKGVLGRMLAHGGLGRAEERSDGIMYARIRIVPDELIWEPSILVMPHDGELELEVINDDSNTHCVVLPNNGDSQFLWLPVYSKGSARIKLDGPGYYWYGSPIGNDEGRGLTAAIVVLGDVPERARLARPPQPQP